AAQSVLVPARTTNLVYGIYPVNPFTYSDNGDGTATITGYTGTNGNVTIPATIDGLTVNQLGPNAFANNNYLTSISVPASVTSIGNDAVANSPNLAFVYFAGPAPS